MKFWMLKLQFLSSSNATFTNGLVKVNELGSRVMWSFEPVQDDLHWGGKGFDPEQRHKERISCIWEILIQRHRVYIFRSVTLYSGLENFKFLDFFHLGNWSEPATCRQCLTAVRHALKAHHQCSKVTKDKSVAGTCLFPPKWITVHHAWAGWAHAQEDFNHASRKRKSGTL